MVVDVGAKANPMIRCLPLDKFMIYFAYAIAIKQTRDNPLHLSRPLISYAF